MPILSKDKEIEFTQSIVNKYSETYNSLSCKKSFETYLNDLIHGFQKNAQSYERIDTKLISKKKELLLKTKIFCFYTLLCDYLNIEGVQKKISKKGAADAYQKSLACKNITVNSTVAPDILSKPSIVYTAALSVDDLSVFNKAYSTKTLSEYCHSIITQTYNWLKDENGLLIKYPFLSSLNSTKTKNFIQKDIELLFLQALEKDVISLSKKEVLDIYPSEYINFMPVDHTNRKTTNFVVQNNNGYVHKIDDHSKITIYIANNDKGETNTPKLFNLFDEKVVKVLIELSDSTFFATKTVVCTLGEIVDRIKDYRSGNLYPQVRQSLIKISSYQAVFENSQTGESKYLDIFKADITNPSLHTKDIILDDNLIGKETEASFSKLLVKVVFSEKYLNSLFEGAVFTEKNLSFSSNLAQALLGPLQSKRYEALSNNQTEIKLGYHSFFNVTLLLGNSNKARNILAIENALNEIVATNTILTDSYRAKDFFIVTFAEMQPNEKDKIINSLESYTAKGLTLSLPFGLNL